jgi:hypothetical protein
VGRKIQFNIDGVLLKSELSKVDRSKLYGSTKKVVKSSDGNNCILSDLYEGSVILPRGSVSQVLVDKKGNSISRSDLIGFNSNSQKVEKVPSIFSIENKCSKSTIDEFLSVNVKSIYQLKIDEADINDWKKSFIDDDVYHFDFNYREDFEGDDAYMIFNGVEFFAVVGKKNDFEYLELNNIVVDDGEDEEIEDDLDFSMF